MYRSNTVVQIACLLVFLSMMACSKPEPVVAKASEICHLGSDLGWKQCDAQSTCLSDSSLPLLKPREQGSKPPVITTESGSANSKDYDCYGFLSDKCVRKGTCYAKVGLGGFCAGENAMCTEGKCLGTVKEGKQVWTCMVAKSTPTPLTPTKPTPEPKPTP